MQLSFFLRKKKADHIPPPHPGVPFSPDIPPISVHHASGHQLQMLKVLNQDLLWSHPTLRHFQCQLEKVVSDENLPKEIGSPPKKWSEKTHRSLVRFECSETNKSIGSILNRRFFFRPFLFFGRKKTLWLVGLFLNFPGANNLKVF